MAGVAVALLLAHLLVAQLTLIVAVLMAGTGRLTRWRPSWLLLPAVAGVTWIVIIGPGPAVAGFLAGPDRVIGYLTAPGHQLAHLIRPGPAFSGLRSWLPRQLPLAVLAGTAEAFLVLLPGWIRSRRAGTGRVRLAGSGAAEPGLPGDGAAGAGDGRFRPGPVAVLRRGLTAWGIRAGALTAPDAACLGVAQHTGGPARLPWRVAEGGMVLYSPSLYGPDGGRAARAGTPGLAGPMIADALRQRKPVLVVDCQDGRELPELFLSSCAREGIPAWIAGPALPGRLARSGTVAACYQPFRGPDPALRDPALRAALVTAMPGWRSGQAATRRGLSACLTDIFALLDAVPSGQRVPLFDELIHLLDPVALRARARQLPAGHPLSAELRARAETSASVLTADPGLGSGLARQLRELRSSPAAALLIPPVGLSRAELSLDQVLATRGAAYFGLGPAAGLPMLIRLLLADLARLAAALARSGPGGDGLVILAGCPAQLAEPVSELFPVAGRAGLAILVSTGDERLTARLATTANVLLTGRVTDVGLARRLALLAGGPLPGPGTGGAERPPLVRPADLMRLGTGEFLMATRTPREAARIRRVR